MNRTPFSRLNTSLSQPMDYTRIICEASRYSHSPIFLGGLRLTSSRVCFPRRSHMRIYTISSPICQVPSPLALLFQAVVGRRYTCVYYPQPMNSETCFRGTDLNRRPPSCLMVTVLYQLSYSEVVAPLS